MLNFRQHVVGAFFPRFRFGIAFALDADEVPDLTIGIEHGAEHQAVPEARTIGAVIVDIDLDIAAIRNGIAQFRDRIGIGLLALKEPAIAADHRTARIACQPFERIADEHQRHIFDMGIGNG